MLLIACPYCGERDQSEFAYGGEAHISRPLWREEMSDGEWAEFVFMRTNPKGVLAERWVHAAGCRRWFNMLRNTATDDILAVYRMGEKPSKVSANLPATPSGEAAIGSGNEAARIIDPAAAASRRGAVGKGKGERGA